MKILIVDDDTLILRIVERMITKMGHECSLANNGQEAYEILKEDFTFDIIISDFNMPVMTGLDLRLKIESDFKSCPPFILFSGSVEQVEKEEHKKMFYALLDKSELEVIADKVKALEREQRNHRRG